MKDEIIGILNKSPGLTGRQIAKKIGCEKREVNSFLAKNPDGLIQVDWKWYVDDNYCLQLVSDTWINEEIFESCFQKAGCLLTATSSHCVIKFPRKCKLLLIAGARIIAIANQAVFLGKRIILDFTDCLTTKNYLDRLGFFDHLHDDVEVLPDRPVTSKAIQYHGNSDNLVEIASIDLANFDFSLPEMLTKAFVRHAGNEYYQAAFTIFSELIGNVQEHSETPIPGFASLQLYKGNRRHIQTVVSDSGLGIASTLKRNLLEHYPGEYDDLDLDIVESDFLLIKQVLTKGGLSQFGSDPDEAARGLGLNRTQSYAAKYDAEVLIRQATYEIKVIYKNGKLVDFYDKSQLPLILGTQVCFDFYLS